MTKAELFFETIRDRRVIVCGLGHNNVPVVHQFVQAGAQVVGCDRRDRAALGAAADELEDIGVELRLGEDYLNGLDADLILRTPGMKPYLPPFEEARRRGARVTSEMELFFELCPAPICAVTGSDGKTTTTTVIARLLEASGRRVHLGGNIGRSLLPVIHEVRPEDVVVAELSSFQLTQMCQSPQTAVVTNLAPNHLDWHTDLDEYITAKRNLVAYQTASDRAVLNADNPLTAAFAEATAAEVFLFSRRHPVERGAWLDADGWLCASDGNTVERILPAADIKLPGDHNIENYLAAFAAVFGSVPPATEAAFARDFGGVPHRCELVRTRRGVRWYNDSIGSSPSRTVAGLKAFDRPVILIAGGYDKNLSYAPLGEAAVGRVKTAILLGATADKIGQALAAAAPEIPTVRVADMAGAVAQAAAMAGEGDIVFLSPASASFDMYKNFEERGEHFRALVNDLPD